MFTKLELDMPDEWDSNCAVWLVVGDFKNSRTVDYIELLINCAWIFINFPV